jgi:hypothetical protein
MGKPTADILNTSDNSISWQRDIPLLTNPLLIGTFIAVVGISLVVLEVGVALVSFLFGDELVFLPPELLAIIFAALLVISALATLIMGNRYHLGYILNSKEITQVTFQKTTVAMRVLAGIATLLGALSALRMATSKGSRQELVVPWHSVRKVIVRRSLNVITLNDGWLPLMQIYCPPGDFDSILAFIQAHKPVAKEHLNEPVTDRLYKWWFYTGLGALVLLATLATLSWDWASYDNTQEIGLLAGIVTLVVVASWASWISVLVAVLSALGSIWFLAQTLLSAFEPFSGGMTYMLDPGYLVLSVCGGLVLLAVAIGRWLDTSAPKPSKRAKQLPGQ